MITTNTILGTTDETVRPYKDVTKNCLLSTIIALILKRNIKIAEINPTVKVQNKTFTRLVNKVDSTNCVMDCSQ